MEKINEPVAYRYEDKSDPLVFYFTTRKDKTENPDAIEIPLYTHPVKEQSTNERIEMLKEMIEKIANPVGWIGYQEGHLVSFLKTQEQVNSFLTATDPTGRVEPVYTHPVKYCPSENNADYEKGFIDGMAKMTESAVHCAVEGMAVKELTDEEIIACIDESEPDTADMIRFARAILRKAQEK